jgi:hypothetical protein
MDAALIVCGGAQVMGGVAAGRGSTPLPISILVLRLADVCLRGFVVGRVLVRMVLLVVAWPGLLVARWDASLSTSPPPPALWACMPHPLSPYIVGLHPVHGSHRPAPTTRLPSHINTLLLLRL